MKTNNLKKFIAIFTAVALVCVMLPLSVGAGEIIPPAVSELYATHSTFVMSGAANENVPHPNTVAQEVLQVEVGTGVDGHRVSFISFDLSEFINNQTIIEEIRLRLRVINATTPGNFSFFILPQAYENFDPDTLTYRMAYDSGMIMMYEDLAFSGNVAGPTGTDFITGDLWPAIQRHIQRYPQNRRITIKISEAGPTPTTGVRRMMFFAGAGVDNVAHRPTLLISNFSGSSGLVDIAMNDTNFSTISNEDINNVTANLTLPTMGPNGVNIRWSSSNEAIINPNTGVVTRPAYATGGDAEVTLTARFAHGAISRTKDFNLTVLRNRNNPLFTPQDVFIAADSVYVSAQTPNAVMGNSVLLGEFIPGVRRVSFVSFDFSSLRNNLNNINTAMLRLIPLNGGVNESGNVTIVVNLMTPEVSWDSNTLTSNLALTSGMLIGGAQSGTQVFTFSGALGEIEALYTNNLISALRNHFATNPANNIVTFRIASNSGAFAFYGTGALADDIKPTLATISYATALREAAVDLQFSDISVENINWVREDVSFIDTGLYNTPISWSSSNPAVINPTTGEVTRLQQDATVTLTATLSNVSGTATRTFVVTVLGTGSDDAFFRMLLDNISFDVMALNDNVNFPAKAEQMPIIWTSESPAISINDNLIIVNRPRSGHTTAVITATITYENVSVSKDFEFFVIRHRSADQLFRRDISNPAGNEINAIDDNLNTVWEIGTQRTLTIDSADGTLGAVRPFAEIMLITTGAPTSGIVVRGSNNGYNWHYIMTSGLVIPNRANHLIPESIAVTRFLEFTFPQGITGVRFLAGYATVSEGPTVGGGYFNDVTIPNPIIGDFQLPQTTQGRPVTWTSSNANVVRIEGEWARVTRPVGSDVNVNLTGSITRHDGTPLNEVYSRSVLRQSGGPGPGPGPGPGGGGGGFGGPPTSNVTMPNNPIVLPETDPDLIPPQYGDVFVDLDEAAWARDYIMSLYNSRIIFGRDEGIFAPNGTLLREEMAALIVRAFELSAGDAGVDFSDVNSWDWFYDAVRAMYANGITQGMGNGEYGVGLNISRQHAVLLIKRVLETAGVELAAVSEQLFVDDEAIADYAREAVYTLRAMGIIGGDENGNFNPTNSISRAEISRILYSALALL